MEPLIPPMRDPAGTSDYYRDYFWIRDTSDESWLAKFPTLQLIYQLGGTVSGFSTHREYLSHQYGRGDSLEAIAQSLKTRTLQLIEGAEFVRQHRHHSTFVTTHPVDGIWRLDFKFAGLTLLLVDSGNDLALFRQLLSPIEKDRGYLFDLLVKSFVPDYDLAKKYTADKYSVDWTNPIVAVLALPAEKRSAAMAAHMRNWNRLMRRYWAFGEKHLVADFAFEVALAVCAYDIDDSGFRDHPYYPRDLVDHYRTHLRHSRDGWRAEGVGAGVPIKAPPPPKKADLAKSKRKGIARWVELASDGDIDATEAVIEQVGKPRKIKDLGALTCALAENDAGLHADIKDDETLETQLAQLCAARGLGDFEAPANPPAGPARCEALLPAGDQWLKPRGYRLVALAGDEWQAVLVRADYLDEFLALSQTLAIPAHLPELASDE